MRFVYFQGKKKHWTEKISNETKDINIMYVFKFAMQILKKTPLADFFFITFISDKIHKM